MVNASGVFFHLEELHSVTDGIRECLANDGVFVVQFLYMKQIVENLAFDQIYHEHLLYYNLATIETLLNRHGLTMFDAYVAPIHGGSVIGFVTHQGRREPTERLNKLRTAEQKNCSNELATYLEFARRIEQMKAENVAYLEEAKRLGKTIYGMGAPVKGNTLLNYFGIGRQYLDCLVEKNELRQRLVLARAASAGRARTRNHDSARRLLRPGLELQAGDPGQQPTAARPGRRVLFPG